MPGRGRGQSNGKPSHKSGDSGNEGQKDCEEEQGAAGGEPNLEEEGSEPTLADIANILKAHIGQQRAREDQWNRDAARQELKFNELQKQFALFKMEVQTQTTPTVRPTHGLEPEEVASPAYSQTGDSLYAHPHFSPAPKLQKLSEDDDIEHFLITFERIAIACRWPKADWAFHLIPLLTGKARGAFVHMDVDLSMNYDQVKQAILQKYDINSETYRQRFRSLQVEPEETPKELYIRLKELYGKWVQPKGKTVGQINEIIILEQYLRMLSPELQVWIKEHDPKSAEEAASLADVFVAARRKNQSWAYKSWKKDDRNQPQAQQVSSVGKPPAKEKIATSHASKFQGKKPICYLCGQEGHTKPMCPQNPVKMSQMCFVPREELQKAGAMQPLKETSVELNGQALKALIDTGSTQTLVQRRYVPSQSVCTSETIPICCVHGDEKNYPTADVYVTVNGQTYLLNVGVVENLPFPVILGGDFPVLIDLLQSAKCNVALTRAQAKQSEETVSDLSTLPFYDVEFFPEKTKERKSKSQRRREKFQGTVVAPSDSPEPKVQHEFKIPGNILELQH